MARVIRGGATRSRVVPAEVFDARAQGSRIVAEARTEAATLVAAARAEAERLVADARKAGREEGIARAAALLAEAGGIRDHALAEAEREAVTLALAAAKRIVGEEIALAPERIADIVGEVLSRARRAQRVVVRVHPDDARTLESLRDRVAARAAGTASFAIEADASITRGGCVVATDVGELDARLEVKLDALARALGCEP